MVKVAVIGGGSLGVKIIGELAYHGHEVRVYDQSPEALDRVRLRLQEDKRLLAEDGLISSASFLGNIYYISRLEEAVKTSDFIFESVPDDLALKQDLFEWITQCCRSDAVVATNSMNLNVDEITKRASHKERCLVLRFLFPVYCIPEVEIVPSKSTSLGTIEKVRTFLARMGKVAFFRSGTVPLVLSNEQREAKKSEFLKALREQKGNVANLHRNVPNLSDKQILIKSAEPDLVSEDFVRGERECVVCMDGARDCVLHPCHHMATCVPCGRLLLRRQDACPVCRAPLASIFRVYHP